MGTTRGLSGVGPVAAARQHRRPTYGPDFGAVVATDVDATDWWCDGYPAGAHVALGPYTALVFSQDPE